MPKRAIFAPLFRQLYRCFLQITGKLLQLALETLKQRNRIRGRTRKPGNHFVLVQTSRLPCGVLHHVIAHGHLSIGDQHYFGIFAHAQHGSSMHCAVPLRTILATWHSPIIRRALSPRQNAVNSEIRCTNYAAPGAWFRVNAK